MNSALFRLFRLSACVSVLGAWFLGTSSNAQTKGDVSLKSVIHDFTGDSTSEHWTVAWVTTSTGTFVKTLWRQGPTITESHWSSHCGTWWTAKQNTANGGNNVVDGYTSATATDYTGTIASPSTNNPIDPIWNCRDANNNVVADGDYRFYIQYAEDAGQGPVTTAIAWTKGASTFSQTYANQGTMGSPSGGNNFTDISVAWKPQNVSVAVSPTSVTEDGAPNLVYTFTRSGDTTAALTANFNVGGTATLTTDYAQSGAATFSASSGTVNFAAGSATATVTINPVTDTTLEPDETVILTVASGTGNYNVGSPSAATGTIANDEVSATVSVAVSPSSVTEDGASNLVYTFTRTGATTAALTASFSVGGTAVFSSDYTQSGAASFTTSTGTVTIPIGSTTATVTIDPVADTNVETDETAVLTVTTGSGYTVGAPASATGTITNDDTPYSSWASGLSVGQNGPTQMPMGDGVTNLEKFAFNLNATAPDVRHLTAGAGALTESAGLPAGSRVGGVLRLEFLRRKGPNPGVTYSPQFSSSLGGWVDFTGTESVSPAADPSWERVTVDDTVGGTVRFGRVKVSQTP